MTHRAAGLNQLGPSPRAMRMEAMVAKDTNPFPVRHQGDDRTLRQQQATALAFHPKPIRLARPKSVTRAQAADFLAWRSTSDSKA